MFSLQVFPENPMPCDTSVSFAAKDLRMAEHCTFCQRCIFHHSLCPTAKPRQALLLLETRHEPLCKTTFDLVGKTYLFESLYGAGKSKCQQSKFQLRLRFTMSTQRSYSENAHHRNQREQSSITWRAPLFCRFCPTTAASRACARAKRRGAAKGLLVGSFWNSEVLFVVAVLPLM